MASFLTYFANIVISDLRYHSLSGTLSMCGKTIDVVHFVAQIKEIIMGTTEMIYLLADHSGAVRAINQDAVGDLAQINRYYIIRGNLTFINGYIGVNIKEMHAISDTRDIIQHLFKAYFANVNELPFSYFSMRGTSRLQNDTSSKVNKTTVLVFNIIDSDRSPDGMNIFDICKKIPSECLNYLKDSLLYLREIGLIDTSDLLHYKSKNKRIIS